MYSLVTIGRTDDAAGTGTVAAVWTAAGADTDRAREVVPNLVGSRLGIVPTQFHPSWWLGVGAGVRLTHHSALFI